MMKRFFVILLTCVLAGSLVGCSFSDGVKDGMKDAQKQESTGDSQKQGGNATILPPTQVHSGRMCKALRTEPLKNVRFYGCIKLCREFKIELLTDGTCGGCVPFGKRKPDAKVKIGIDMDDYYRIRENAESK